MKILPDSKNLKLLGRTYRDQEDRLWCGFSGSGAEFMFFGTRCTITLEGDEVSQRPDDLINYARVAIEVNQNRVVDCVMDQPKKTFTVWESDEPKEVEVRIIKLSEAAMSCAAIGEIQVEGEHIRPTPDKDLLIEFIGDSITCGFGVDENHEERPFSTSTEDVTKAYAYRTAKELNADYSMVCLSGYGIISGYTTTTKNTKETIPQYYSKIGFSYGGFGSIKPQDLEWDFQSRQPQIIFINLGTNDDSYTQDDQNLQKEFQENYTAFLKKVRSYNPDAAILCGIGIMGDRLFESICCAVNDYTNQTQDENISVMRFDVQDPKNGYGAVWHPSYLTQTIATDRLTQILKYHLSKPKEKA